MNVEELLEQCRKDYLDDHTEMIRGADDRMFSDEALIRWFNEGQNRFATNVWVIESIGPEQPDVSVVTLQTGENTYPLNNAVRHVHSARLSDSETDLARTDYNTIRPTGARYNDPDYWDINSPGTATPGRPSWFATDIGGKNIRFRTTPGVDQDGLPVYLRVAHLPLVTLTIGELGAIPELPEEYHGAISLYAAGRALLNPNIDIALRAVGQGFMQEFWTMVSHAKRDLHRFKAAMPRYRFGGWVQ